MNEKPHPVPVMGSTICEGFENRVKKCVPIHINADATSFRIKLQAIFVPTMKLS